MVAENIAKPQPATVYASAGNLESLEPLADLEVLENQAATATQMPVATDNQTLVEHAAAQTPAPHKQAASTTAKPLPSTVHAYPRNLASLESPEPLADLESLENQAATATQMPVATDNQTLVEHTAAQSPAPHTQNLSTVTAAQIPAPQPKAAETIAKPQPSIAYAFSRNLESPEPLTDLEVLENQASTATQMPVAIANQIPVEHTAAQSPAPHMQATATTTQDSAPHTQAADISTQVSAPQPKAAETTAKPQLATVYTSARNLESQENQAATIAQKPVATANQMPVEHSAAQIPAPQPQATMVKMMPQAAHTPMTHAAAVPQQSETIEPQRKAMATPVDPQPSTKHVSAKESKSLETAAATIAPAAQQQTVAQPPSLDMPAITPATISKLAFSPNEILASALNELTSAIMVNIDDAGHMNEIRLVLKPDVLDGTTILLKCDQTHVSVTFFPGVESAERILLANQGRIVETIAATGHLPVQVSIINSEGRRQIRKSVA